MTKVASVIYKRLNQDLVRKIEKDVEGSDSHFIGIHSREVNDEVTYIHRRVVHEQQSRP